MGIYSHSKINTFEQCSLKYRLRYIDKIPVPEKSIEAFLGKTVHNALEWLYIEVRKGRIPSIDEVLLYYAENWKKNFTSDIIIVNGDLKAEDYYNKGIKFIIDYYTKHKPFDDNTLEIEKEIWINLDNAGEHKLRGFIDRLTYNKRTGQYEIHDYKTANFLPSREKIENDRQLALYSIAIKELFGEDKEVLLIWHYLAHNLNICLKKTNEELERLRYEILEVIKEIESTRDFLPNVSRLCDWCEYKKMCPSWDIEKKEEIIEENSLN